MKLIETGQWEKMERERKRTEMLLCKNSGTKERGNRVIVVTKAKKGKHKAKNFRYRLATHHSFGKYVNTDTFICDENAIDPDVRRRIDIDDFNPRLVAFLNESNAALQ